MSIETLKKNISDSEKVWDLNIKQRRRTEEERAEIAFKEIKKIIGKKIFTSFGIWKEKDDGYWVAKKIYESIFEYSDNPSLSFLGIDLKIRLSKGHFNLMNDIIQNEYGKILEQAREIEDLKSRLKFYETTHPMPFLKDMHK